MKIVKFDDYVKRKGGVPAIIHFQPHSFGVFESPEEQKAFAKSLAERLGVDDPESFTWGTPTYSGDADYPTHRQGDDCESE